MTTIAAVREFAIGEQHWAFSEKSMRALHWYQLASGLGT
jgi:hypothetical protein